jgi:hypothetical protein
MLIDLNTLDDNVRRFAYIAKKNAKVIRLATKVRNDNHGWDITAIIG